MVAEINGVALRRVGGDYAHGTGRNCRNSACGCRRPDRCRRHKAGRLAQYHGGRSPGHEQLAGRTVASDQPPLGIERMSEEDAFVGMGLGCEQTAD